MFKPFLFKVLCPELEINYATFTKDRNLGTTATISCNNGYHINGPGTINCQDSSPVSRDGQWSAIAPTCEESK
jgi:hypothetical protein